MRLANISKTLLLLAFSAAVVSSAAAQSVGVNPATVRNQLNKAAAAPQSGPAPAKPVAPASPRPSTKAQASGPATPAAAKPGDDKTPFVRRDPFDILLNKARPGNGEPENLPPGKAGLIVDSLRIDGIVQGKGGTIAIVSNPQQRVYFVREGDKLYDGTIEHITLDAVSFHEVGKDAFGKPVERDVTKRLYASPGEPQ